MGACANGAVAPGFEWLLGFPSFPELNCCACGKPPSAAPPPSVPWPPVPPPRPPPPPVSPLPCYDVPGLRRGRSDCVPLPDWLSMLQPEQWSDLPGAERLASESSNPLLAEHARALLVGLALQRLLSESNTSHTCSQPFPAATDTTTSQCHLGEYLVGAPGNTSTCDSNQLFSKSGEFGVCVECYEMAGHLRGYKCENGTLAPCRSGYFCHVDHARRVVREL
eukprot:570954-Prymnesium_polylepis.1